MQVYRVEGKDVPPQKDDERVDMKYTKILVLIDGWVYAKYAKDD